jgi:hypothetical protein
VEKAYLGKLHSEFNAKHGHICTVKFGEVGLILEHFVSFRFFFVLVFDFFIFVFSVFPRF